MPFRSVEQMAVTPKGTAAVDNVYTADRIRPDIVAPAAATSSTTPIVASATTLLVETGHSNPGLSTKRTGNQSQWRYYPQRRAPRGDQSGIDGRCRE